MEILRVGAAFPDPPFNGMPDDGGLDIDLMTAIAELLSATAEFIPYQGTDFNGIFDALNTGAYDCVAAGTTVTPDRQTKAQFVLPYLISGGLGGAVLMGFGGTLLIAQDFRDERTRIRSLESKIGELEDVVVTQAEIMGEAIAILSAAAREVDEELRQAARGRRSRGATRN